MIVVDVNVLAYLVIEGEMTAQALTLLKRDPEWIAPPIWRSEFRNVVLKYIKAYRMDVSEALPWLQRASAVMGSRTIAIDDEAVLRTSVKYGLTAYDAEYAALAATLQLRLYSHDSRLLKALPHLAVPLREVQE